MSWIAPVFPITKNGIVETVLAKDQPQYAPLPVAVVAGRGDLPVIARYRLTADDLQMVLDGGDVIITQLTFCKGYHPINIQVVPQSVNPELTEEVVS